MRPRDLAMPTTGMPIRLFTAFLLCSVPGLRAGAAEKPGARGKSGGSTAVRVGEVTAESFLAHIRVLADDKLEGRGIGQPGIDEAADYIAAQFKSYGLEPTGDDGTYFQTFDLDLWKKLGPKTALTITGDSAPELKLGRDYTPLGLSLGDPFEGGVAFVGYGITQEEGDYDDYAGIDVTGRVVVMLRYEPAFLLDDPKSPDQHSRYAQFRIKTRGAIDHGASAVLIVNPERVAADDTLQDFGNGSPGNLGIPLFQLTRAAANKLLAAGGLPEIEALERKIESSKKPASALIESLTATGLADFIASGPRVRNVIAMRRGEGPAADEVIVIGGHYDHLGKTASMRSPNSEPQIHNGADDNASGTAGMLECARLVSRGAAPPRSMIFMAFSAEESGLLGSKHFADHPTVPIERIAAMLNMDMIGRMRDRVLQIGGQRTGEGLIDIVERRAIEYGFEVKDGGGGRGPSDHTSFYAKDIPVLFFFTGLHRQYHMPDDDVELINGADGARVAQMVADLAYDIAGLPKRLRFTADATPIAMLGAGERGPRNSIRTTGGGVRLGILPNVDDKPGVIIDDVMADSSAAKGGLKADDRIVRVGDCIVSDIESLQAALSKLSPGGSGEVEIVRDGRRMTQSVSFAAAQLADADSPRRPFREDRSDRGRRGDRSRGERGSRDDKPADAADRKPAKDDAKPKTAANPHGDFAEDMPPMPRVRLGIAPSYGGADGKPGYPIEYVVPGGAAAKAGMKDSDRILMIGGKKISDVYSYMSALQPYKPGDKIALVVQRGEEQVELTLTAAGDQTRGAS